MHDHRIVLNVDSMSTTRYSQVGREIGQLDSITYLFPPLIITIRCSPSYRDRLYYLIDLSLYLLVNSK